MINLKGYDIGENILILGSGDIGLIMARRLTLLGKNVLGVIEQFPTCTGLLRNKVQCLDEFDIPLLTGHTVAEVFGTARITGAAICPVDKGLNPLPHPSKTIACDTLITSVGLIPETELLAPLDLMRAGDSLCVSAQAGTSLPWLFVCGNALFVHDLADAVSAEAEQAGQGAAAFVLGRAITAAQHGTFQTADPPKKLNPNEMVCTVCPNSCILTVNKNSVTGGLCSRGIEFARQELKSPRRFVTATVTAAGCAYGRIPARTSVPVTREKIAAVMEEIRTLSILPPVSAGQTLLSNIADSGADLIATAEHSDKCPPV
jgi:CxxC motif-containing protein